MIKFLKWDSDFFGYKVGMVEVGVGISVNIDTLKKKAVGYKLIYIIADKEINMPTGEIKLVDIKTRLGKDVLVEENDAIRPLYNYNEKGYEPVKHLALQSGAYSRYKKDKNFINHEFENLYKKWIDDSVNKKIADEIIVSRSDTGQYDGLATLKYRDHLAEIGLIAVDEQSRGKKIGLSLLYYVNNLTLKKGLNRVEVVTQFENVAAMNLYQKAGYKVMSKKYIYHLWI